MNRRTDVAIDESPRAADPQPRGGTARDLPGDLEALLDGRPVFRTSWRGYDRLQVDNYVTWIEAELLAACRENEDILTRFGSCSAELEGARRLLATSPEGRDLVRTSERVGEILRLAADEAARLTDAGRAEGERILGAARLDADALLRRAREVEEAAVATSERMAEEVRVAREAAADELRQATAEAGRLRAEAEADAERLRAQAADDAERVRAELTQQVTAALQGVMGRIDEALGVLTGVPGGGRVPDRREERLAS